MPHTDPRQAFQMLCEPKLLAQFDAELDSLRSRWGAKLSRTDFLCRLMRDFVERPPAWTRTKIAPKPLVKRGRPRVNGTN